MNEQGEKGIPEEKKCGINQENDRGIGWKNRIEI